MKSLKFPIGEYMPMKNPSSQQVEKWISDIENFPAQVEKVITGKTKSLNYKYRPEGWTVKQVIHHCTDSHINSLIRFKLALTEDHPTIRPYYEDRWAELPDSLSQDVSQSLLLLKALHNKWVFLLKKLTPEQLQLTFYHPENKKTFTLAETIGIYAWHCNHHLAHIQIGISSKGKYN